MSALVPPSGVRVYSVGELTNAVRELLEAAHPSVWVEGEVSNLARPTSGHVYLTLKDDQAPLRAVVYRGVALRLRFDLRDGLRVVVRGRLSVYVPRGDYQLLIEEVHPKGVGPLELAFRQLKERLSVLGYFEPRRKRPLPPLPRRIALITSPTGSAVRDVLEVLARRWPALEVWVCPARVQGDSAAAEIAGALGMVNALAERVPFDLVVLARGGGSLEDLWPFNEEIVARAIFRSRLPVVTGIGHEDDLTIADLVADRRALTPTEAAERIVPDRAELGQTLAGQQSRLRALMGRNLQLARARLTQLADRPCLRRPGDRIDELRRRVDDLSERLARAVTQRVAEARRRLAGLAAQLDGLSPLRVLARGYSLTQRVDGGIVRTSQDVAPGERIITRLRTGTIHSIVEEEGPA